MKAERIDYERLLLQAKQIKEYGEKLERAAVGMGAVTDQARLELKDTVSLATFKKMENDLLQLQRIGSQLIDRMQEAEFVFRKKMEEQKDQDRVDPSSEGTQETN